MYRTRRVLSNSLDYQTIVRYNECGDTMELTALKGVGPKGIQTLKKIGIEQVEDFISYYPFRYDVIKKSDFATLKQDDPIILDGIIESNPTVFYISKKLDKMNFRIQGEDQLFQVVIYNRGFLKKTLKVGTEITVIGKYDLKHNTIVATELRMGLLPSVPKIEPVYHLTYGLSGKNLRQWIDQALKKVPIPNSIVPEEYLRKYNFLKKEDAVFTAHHPSSKEQLNDALERLKYEELFLYMMKMNYLKESRKKQIGLKRNLDYQEIEDFIKNLPFALTEDQKKCVDQIYKDLTEETRMNRLVQGDVGSGKTIVAVIATYMNYLSGYQTAFMAPTEILANQHAKNMKEYFKNTNIKIEVLTGKRKQSEKKKIYEQLKNHEIDLLIGTHAILHDDVIYSNLGLVITDEQHRFGVNQRSNLKNKGMTPDVLSMSATPIPRTYALTLYGDTDLSSIHTMPSGRKPVITLLKHEKEIRDVLEMMLTELKKKHQIYVIAPLVEDSDKIDLENVLSLHEKMTKAFGSHFEVGLLHGKMKKEEKDEVMQKFKENKIQILVSTTVIEVGIDVGNATMMVIFDSFRFGLSTLHQLRGRVGRNELQSYCILMSDYEKERLTVLTETNDGFKISEEDFRLRGSGDLFGVRQSGEMQFSLADIKKDFPLLLKAKEDVEEFMKKEEYQNPNNYLEIKQYIEKINSID